MSHSTSGSGAARSSAQPSAEAGGEVWPKPPAPDAAALGAHKCRQRVAHEHVDVAKAKILEIGALARPTFGRQHGEVYYADRMTTQELQSAYPGKDNLVAVDYVYRTRDLAACFDRTFDLVIAHHVIEHIPDPIYWMQQIAAITNPGGKFVLSVPDRRYTFDVSRQETTSAELLDCYVEELDRPAFRHTFGHKFYYQKLTTRELWDGQRPDPAGRRFTPDVAYRYALKDRAANGSVHCHVFTAQSFAVLFQEIQSIGLLPWTLIDLQDVAPNSNEFYVVLEKVAS